MTKQPPNRDGPRRKARPRLSNRDLLRLIGMSYRATLPYFLVFLLGLILATWLLTTVVF